MQSPDIFQEAMSPQHLAIYLINIDRAADRLAEMRRQSAEFSIELNRVEGVDGQVHPSEDWIDVDVRLFLKRNGRHILPGEYGCYRSHLLALERFLAGGKDAAIVVEDDILLDDTFLARAVSAMEAAPDADVIKFVNHRWKGFRTFTTTAEGDILGRCIFGPQGSTAGYLVTLSGAAKIVSKLRIMSLPWDVAIERGWDNGTSLYSTRSNLVGFTRLRKKTMIGNRETYLSAKLPIWRRIPAHCFRTMDFFRRLHYVLVQSRMSRCNIIDASKGRRPLNGL
ncbi:glycosyltransferase family 25 protein [Rhizobium tumorigenes]|uniref:glycosyltransferase family 25 protein n=1 Tax=Rhizobium tumorigenes TaxID=2041385 RepID=UPI00241ED501|nr:glycosyltransferase family 25 protein [Rhizobium tumorigenes]WFS03562.1 glycosyltransferase family 25 protein [Rhizobium tumorigenes]